MNRTDFENELVSRLHVLADAAPTEPSGNPRQAVHSRSVRPLAVAASLLVLSVGGVAVSSVYEGDTVAVVDPGGQGSTTTGALSRTTMTVPFETTRTRADGVTVTLTVAPFDPTYGPYGADHLLHRGPECPASAHVEISKGEIGKGGGMSAVLPVVLPAGPRRAFLFGHPGRDLVVMVPGVEAGRRYRLVDSDGMALDEAEATDPAIALVDWQVEVTGPNLRPDTLPTFTGRVDELDDAGHVVSSIDVAPMDIEALTPRSCWPANLPVELGRYEPPPDRASAEAAVGEAVRRISDGMGPYVEDFPIEVVDIRWESPTVAWAKYRIAYFPDDDGDGAGTGPIIWADVTFNGTSWVASPAARCVRDRLSGRGSTCPEAPDTVPVE